MMVAGEEYIAVWSGLPEAQKGKPVMHVCSQQRGH